MTLEIQVVAWDRLTDVAWLNSLMEFQLSLGNWNFNVWGQVVIPTAHYSDSPLLQRPIIPIAHCYDGLLFRQSIAPTAHFSDNPSFR